MLSRIFYEWTIGRAAAWGAHVKSAFDLYRFDLLEKLGYDQKPESIAEERALWSMISQHLLYAFVRHEPEDAWAPYANPDLRVKEPTKVRFELHRTIQNAPGPTVDVCILVLNSDPSSKTADRITLVETVPEGFQYVLGSAAASRGACEILALKPLTLRLGALKKGESYTVTYTSEPIPKPTPEAAAK